MVSISVQSSQSFTTRPRLLGDIGGTNVRLGWQAQAGAPITDVKVYACAAFSSLLSVITTYLDELARERPVVAALGIACPMSGDKVSMTNHAWTFSIQAMCQALGLEKLIVLNDFTAQALAVPDLPTTAKVAVGRGVAVEGSPIAVIGPGTGLGVSGLMPNPRGGWLALSGEGGHVTLSACSAREDAVMAWLRAAFGHASAERAVSGQGIENLYRAVCDLDGVHAQPGLSAAAIVERALQRADAHCQEALSLMCSFLGTVAGNLALTLGARGGVYIVGGIVPRLGEAFAQSPFRERFEAKGRYGSFLASVPTWAVYTSVSPALAGAAHALEGLG